MSSTLRAVSGPYTTTDVSTVLPQSNSSPTTMRNDKPCFYSEYRVGTLVLFYWSTNQPYILIVLCLIGNGLTLLGSWERCRRSSAHYYMVVLAAADSLVIGQYAGIFLANNYVKNFASTDAVCKTLVAFEDFTVYFAVWLLVFMTIDRCNAVTRPLQANRICTVKRGVITTITLFIICFSYAALTDGFIIKRLINKDGFANCHVIVPQPWNIVHYWVKLSLSVYVPFAILLIVNMIILSAISKATKRQAEMTTSQNKRRSSTKKLTIMVVVVCLSFFVLTFPVAIANLLYLEYESMDVATGAYLNDCDGHGPAYIFIYYLGVLFNYFNNVINGFVYLASNTQFRNDVAKFVSRFIPPLRRRYERRNETTISTVSSSVAISSAK
ncbi:neuropeptide S receptor-like [Tubulanus polymorphus]|uniref:neuropeptide S receptor-like n=1 Tax=Tubulanus polymorphus TaxID=672921 RepID=UPI003DA2D078